MSESGRAQTAARWTLVAVVLVLLVVPGRLLAADHASDDSLVPFSDAPTVHDQVPTGQAWRTDTRVALATADRVEVVEVRPRVTVDTAKADISVRLCRPQPGGGCAGSAVPSAAAVRLAPGAARLVVTVTPRHAGEVRIDGFDVTYVDGGRRGTEHAGVPVRLHAV